MKILTPYVDGKKVRILLSNIMGFLFRQIYRLLLVGVSGNKSIYKMLSYSMHKHKKSIRKKSEFRY